MLANDLLLNTAVESYSFSTTAPLLRLGAAIKSSENAAVISFRDFQYKFSGISAHTLRAICSRLDGKQKIDAIADSLKLPLSTVKTVINLLIENHLAVNLQSEKVVSPEQFSSACRSLFPEWKERLFSHRLWLDLSRGKASRTQFLGWLLESYHFIAGVNVRLALAVAECSEHSIRSLFAQHYSEEYDHCHFFMSALNDFGLSKEEILNSRPLPGTLAILNFMRQCARADSLQYAVCSGFLESTGTDRERGREFFSHLMKYYSPEKTSAIQPLVEHINLDEAYGHNSLMEAIVDKLGDIPLERASAAINAGSLLVETLEMWSTDIRRNYSASEFKLRINPNQYRVRISTGSQIVN